MGMADEEEPTQTSGGQMDLMDALKECLKKALIHDGVARGLHECAKALDRRQAHLCVLASNCNEAAYTKLVEALCSEHGINLLKVPDSKQLGEWVGLARSTRKALPARSLRARALSSTTTVRSLPPARLSLSTSRVSKRSNLMNTRLTRQCFVWQ